MILCGLSPIKHRFICPRMTTLTKYDNDSVSCVLQVARETYARVYVGCKDNNNNNVLRFMLIVVCIVG